MRDVDSAFLATLQNARQRGLVPRKLVTVTAKEFVTAATSRLSFWTGHEDLTMTVNSGLNGLPSNRLFYGGVDLEVSPIARVADMTIQTVTLSMSQIADPVQQLVRGLDIRLAKVEIWEALLDPDSRLLVSTPPLVWLGEVDGSPITTPSIGEEGRVEINTVSDAISMLTRKNPLKSSYEAQKRRSADANNPDEWGKYSAVVKTWEIPWGRKK